MKKILFTFLLLGWLANLSAQNIQRLEYFIDTDPGFGAGVLVPFSGTTTANSNFNIPLSSGLSDGIHKIYFRAKESNGKWSLVQSQNFFKIGLETSTSNIAKLEYFIDSDPGYGLAVNIPIIAGQTITKELSIPIAQNLPLGFHKIYIRAKDASGKWSVVYQQNFFKNNILVTPPHLVKLEYFVDTDPGFGNATSIPINPGQTVNLENINLSLPIGLTTGEHVLYIRGQDALGKWAIISSPKFMNCPTGTLLSVIGNPYKCLGTTQMSAEIPIGVSSWVWLKDNAEIGHTGETSISVTEGGNYAVKTQTGLTNACSTQVSNQVKVVFAEEDKVSTKTNRNLVNCDQAAKLEIDNTNTLISAPEHVSFQWFKNNVLFENNASSITITPGTYKLKATYHGPLAACNTLESSPLVLAELPISLNISPISHQPNIVKLCSGSSVDFLAETSINSGLSFQWFRNDVLLNGQTESQLLNVSLDGNYKYQVSSGLCQNLASGIVEVQTVTATTIVSTISLLTGSLSSCPGSSASIGISGCTGTPIWNTQDNNPALEVIQLNKAQTYSAYCLNSCLSKANNTLTFQPLAAGLPVPKILTDDFPISTNYIVKHSSRTHGDAFRYNNYDSPVALVPLQGGTTYFIDEQLNMNAILPDGNLKFGQIINHNVPNTGGSDIANVGRDKLLLVGQTTSGITGQKTMSSNGALDIWLLYRDLTGVFLSDKSYGGGGNDYAVKILVKNENEIYLIANSYSGTSGNKTSATFGISDIWVLKLDANGNKLAEASFGGNNLDLASDAILLSNGQIAITGLSKSPASGNKTSGLNSTQDQWTLVIDSNLNLIWERSLAHASLASNAGISILEKNNHLFIAQFGGRLTKYDFSGNIVLNVAFNFSDHPNATSSKLDFKNLLKGPHGELMAIGRGSGAVSMFGNGATQLFEYYNIMSFEFDESLSLVENTRKRYGTHYTALEDIAGPGFYDADGILNILMVSDVPTCNSLVGNTYFLDNSADYVTLCNRGNVTDGHWFMWKMSKYAYSETAFNDYCKGKQLALQASYTENFPLANALQFKWTNGQNGQHIIYNSDTDKPIYAYVLNNIPNTCGSPVVKSPHTPYPERLNISGNQGTDKSRYTYQTLVSSEKIDAANTVYRSGGSILLNPGFIVQPASNKPFKAEIGGCIN